MQFLILFFLLGTSMLLAQPPKTSWDKRGTGVPVEPCSAVNHVGTRFSRTNGAEVASTLYVCNNTGVGTYAWELMKSEMKISVQNNGTLVGTENTINHVPGFGILNSLSVSAGVIITQPAVDTATIQSRATAQAGSSLYCRSLTGNDAYTCSLLPTLTAYTTGSCIVLNPNFTNIGASTINIDELGVKNILTKALVNTATGDLPLDAPSNMCYNGTSFVIQGDGGGAAPAPVTVSQWWCPMGNCTSTRNGTFVLGTANRTYFWRFYADRNRFVRRIALPGWPIAGTQVYGIYNTDGTTLLASCNSAATGVSPGGGIMVCDIGSQYTLVDGTEYMLTLSTDGTTTAVNCAGGDNAYEVQNLFAAQSTYFPNSRTMWGFGTNVSSGAGVDMVLPATLGAETQANQCAPQVFFLPN